MDSQCDSHRQKRVSVTDSVTHGIQATADEWDKMDCSLISYNDPVVFEYSGGAIGGDCFLGREEHLKVKSKN
ncbi:MAG: hypothetical protein IKG88_08045 [Bacteroidales bacterium]|nr:hypothetical protein [Bacteroidales bacterium]